MIFINIITCTHSGGISENLSAYAAKISKQIVNSLGKSPVKTGFQEF